MKNIRRFFLYMVTVFIGLVNLDALAVTVKGTVKPGFPKLAHYAIGGPHAWNKTDSEGVTYRTALARLDMAIINFLPAVSNPAQIAGIRDLKVRNPNMFLFDYNMLMQQRFNNAGGAGDYVDELDTNRWWVYRSGDSGTILRTAYNTAFGFTNITNFARVNADGDRWNTFFAKELKRRTHDLVPEFDGTFTDEFGLQPPPAESAGGTENKGDWNRDGTADDRGSTLVQNAWRDGNATFIGALRTNIPGDIHTANVGPWKGKPPSQIPQYNNLLEGGVLEQYLSNTPAEPAFVNALAGYHQIMGMLKNPKLLVVIGKTETLSIEYDAMRYGLAFTLMDNGYFMFSKGNSNVLQRDAGYGEAPPWFDEYDPPGVPGGTSWLGEPIEGPQTTPWQNGVYKREFQFGAALVNPKGNGTRTVTLPAGEFKRIDGDQVPSINTGQAVTNPTLNERDGLLLVRVSGATGGDSTAPTAPTNLAATAPSATRVDLTWTASTDSVGVTGYRVQRCSGSSTCTNFIQISTTPGTFFSDTALAANTIYRYRVRAEDAAGNLSANSGTVSATTLAATDTTPPSVPTNLRATAPSATRVNLLWNASTDNVGVTSYRLQRCLGTNCTNFSLLRTIFTGTSYADESVSGGQVYRYRVRAVDAAVNVSEFSSIISITTP